MELKKLGLGLASVAVAASLVNADAVKAAETDKAEDPKTEQTAPAEKPEATTPDAGKEEAAKPEADKDNTADKDDQAKPEADANKELAAKKAELLKLIEDNADTLLGYANTFKAQVNNATSMDRLAKLEAGINAAIKGEDPNDAAEDKELTAKKAELMKLVEDNADLLKDKVSSYNERIKSAGDMATLSSLEKDIKAAIDDAMTPDLGDEVSNKKTELIVLVEAQAEKLGEDKVASFKSDIQKATTVKELEEIEAKIKATIVGNQDKPTDPEKKEYTVQYVIKDKDGKVVKVLQTENWTNWDDMEKGSVATANSFVEKYGKWDVEATAEGLTYVFTQKEDKPTDPEKKEYTVKYVIKDKNGKIVKVLQTETWTNWDAMEKGSVMVANAFAEKYGKWDVEATPEGLTYVFMQKEDGDKDSMPWMPLTPAKPIKGDKEDMNKDNMSGKKEDKQAMKKEQKAANKLPQTGATAAGLGLGLVLSAVGSAFAFKKRQ